MDSIQERVLALFDPVFNHVTLLVVVSLLLVVGFGEFRHDAEFVIECRSRLCEMIEKGAFLIDLVIDTVHGILEMIEVSVDEKGLVA